MYNMLRSGLSLDKWRFSDRTDKLVASLKRAKIKEDCCNNKTNSKLKNLIAINSNAVL